MFYLQAPVENRSAVSIFSIFFLLLRLKKRSNFLLQVQVLLFSRFVAVLLFCFFVLLFLPQNSHVHTQPGQILRAQLGSCVICNECVMSLAIQTAARRLRRSHQVQSVHATHGSSSTFTVTYSSFCTVAGNNSSLPSTQRPVR